MSERDSFEAWWERAHNNGNPPRFGWQHWRSGDGYLVDDDDEEFQWRWEAWQASREALKDEQVGDGWIACADRMPEIEDRVLVVTYGKYVSAARYTQWEGAKTAKGRAPRFEDLRGIVYNVTHWMPLPSPPAVNHPIDTTSQQYEALSKD